MKIMVTGGNGFLGQHLCRSLKDEYEVFALGKGEKRIPFMDVKYYPADVTEAEKLKDVFTEAEPEVVIHTAAMSKPDECDNNRELCDEVNVTGTHNVVVAAKGLKHQPHIIYTSSDFVLGEGGPHDEDAVPAPLNYYGNSKLLAEKVVEDSGLMYTIVRPVFMYGETWQGMRSTFLHWVKHSLEERKPIKVVSDQLRTPTHVSDICKGIKAIIDKRAEGLYHLGGAERISPYDMAVQLAEWLSLDGSLITPVTAETFNEPVKRAKEGGVIINKAVQQLDFHPVNFQTGLQMVFG